jgi:hypothetical protein
MQNRLIQKTAAVAANLNVNAAWCSVFPSAILRVNIVI